MTTDDVQQPRWPWIWLGLAMLWVALVRVPLVLHAREHLDSDLAVDGLVLVEAMHGEWRWHYPGTPFSGTVPVFLSMPAALVAGVSAGSLVTGGVIAYELVLIATFLLAWRGFGARAAVWSLVPLSFASVGIVWLSGRITGGHLVSVVWHGGAFLGMLEVLRHGGLARTAMLGLWCGLGLYVDWSFLASLFGIGPMLVAGGLGPGATWKKVVAVVLFPLAMAAGYAPHWVGERVNPYDAYGGQFSTIFRDERTGKTDSDQAKALAKEHLRLLAMECVPRLVGGHRLPGFQAEPSAEALRGRARRRDKADVAVVPVSMTALGLGLLGASVLGLLVCSGSRRDLASDLVRGGLVVSAGVTLAGFVANRNIYNSDNYRYLVTLIVPWALGLCLGAARLWEKGTGGKAVVAGLAVALAVFSTLDLARWYGGFGWVNGWGVPVREQGEDEVAAWLEEHPEVEAIYGGYWDVYRLSFLTGGRVKGVPFPEYPDRFPEWTRQFPGSRPGTMVARTGDGIGRFNLDRAMREGGEVRASFGDVRVVRWPMDAVREGEGLGER